MRSKWTALMLLPAFAACAAASAPELDTPTGYVEVYDESAYEFLQNDMRPVIRANGFNWAEGPVWVEDGQFLLFSDVPENVVHKYEPGVGASVYLEPSGATGRHDGDYASGSNGLVLDKDKRLVLAQHGDRVIGVMQAPTSNPRPAYTVMASHFEGKRFNSPNDLVYHSDGSLYFTDPPYGLTDNMNDERKELPFQGVYRLGPDGVTLLDKTVTFPNGIGLSPDEKTLYVSVSDHSAPKWLAWDLDEKGLAKNRRLFFDAAELAVVHEGMPDGMAVHSSGAIFATGPGGVFLFSPEGALLARVFTGRRAANCTLSADESTLYIAADDSLMSLLLVGVSE